MSDNDNDERPTVGPALWSFGDEGTRVVLSPMRTAKPALAVSASGMVPEGAKAFFTLMILPDHARDLRDALDSWLEGR